MNRRFTMQTSVGQRESSLEILETRIAPSTITFVDVDGDAVSIKSSKGDLTGKATYVDVGAGKQLVELDLNDPAFQGANLSISATPGAHGDGFVNIGYINATGRDLGMVAVDGDLGRIDAGDVDSATAGLVKLSVRSLGRLGSATQPMGVSNLASNIVGKLGTVSITTDLVDATITVTGANGTDAHGQPVNFGQIGLLKIGDSFLGGSVAASSVVSASGDIAKVMVGEDLLGGSATGAGVISSAGKILAVSIGGALLGGSGTTSGKISADQQIGPVKISGNVLGGDGSDSAKLSSGGLLTSLTISGSFAGGSGSSSAHVIAAGIGPIKIGHDLVGGKGNSSAYLDGGHQRVTSLAVGGSWIGGNGSNSGFIYTSGGLGPTTITGDLRGGAGSGSGQIDVEGLDKILIRGSMIGGAGNYSGMIYSDGNIGPVTILGDIQGGAGLNSGQIEGAQQYITSVQIGGSIIGGSGSGSGGIDAGGQKVGPITIGKNIIGGSASGMASVTNSGFIHVGHVDSLTIGGSIVAGTNTSTGTLRYSGSIAVDDDVGSITIKGSLVGNASNPVVILAGGTGVINGADKAIGSLAVSGRVDHALVLAGYAFSYSALGSASDGNAQIGKVSAGEWIASTIVAGAAAGTDGLFGTIDDEVIGGVVGSIARIASITIDGSITGSATAGDHFGFVAPKIAAMKVVGISYSLQPGVDAIEFSPATGDTTLREV